MTSQTTIAGLVAKRAELAGEIDSAEATLSQLRADLLHIDAAIRILDPSYKTDAIRPKKKRKGADWFGNGELLRLILETLRKAGEPLTSKEVALAVMERKGFDTTDETTVRLVEKRVFAGLHRRQGKLVQRVEYGPRSVGWRV
jgi:hypothetical protein